MSALGPPRSNKSRSLPRMGTSTCRRRNEIASFDDLVYLGSHKVKKSYLVVNDNISSVLDYRDSKEYTTAKIELYRDAIHLKNSKEDRLLDIHQLEWILSTSLFDEDRRYFGYISSKAFKGSKTRTACHVFRCNRVGMASQIMETIRQACQATYLARTSDYPSELRSRTNSNTSTSSEGSISSSSDTVSLGSTNSSPSEVELRVRKKPGRFIPKRLSRNRMSTIQSFHEEDTDTGIETLGEEPPEVGALGERRTTRDARDEVPQPPAIIPPSPDNVPLPPGKVSEPPERVSQSSNDRVLPPDEAPTSEDCRSEERTLNERVPEESTEKQFTVFYLISTILSPPLKAKHVKECLKQFQKSVDKAMKKSGNNSQHYKKAQLVFSPKGVMIVDEQTQSPQAFYERATISAVQSHPDGKCAFAFTTVVSGNTKHKCHLFLQDQDPIGPIIKELKTYIP